MVSFCTYDMEDVWNCDLTYFTKFWYLFIVALEMTRTLLLQLQKQGYGPTIFGDI